MSVQDDIREQIARLRALQDAPGQVAPDVARVIDANLRRSIAAGQTPDGVAWQPTKQGEQPLRHAGGALNVGAYGGTVFVTLKGPEARHDKGQARGGIKREVIPSTSKVPDRMAAEIKVILDRWFEERMGGPNG